MYFIQHFICRPSDSTVSEDAEIEPRTVSASELAVRRSNHSARSQILQYLLINMYLCSRTAGDGAGQEQKGERRSTGRDEYSRQVIGIRALEGTNTTGKLSALEHCKRREIILLEANPMSGVFRNIDPHPPPPCPASVSVPPAFGAGEDTLAGWNGGGESIFWKTPDTALYSTYVSTL